MCFSKCMWFWSHSINTITLNTMSICYTPVVVFIFLFGASSSCQPTPIFIFVDVGFRHSVNDSLMRFFDQCKRFVEDVDHNKTALKEVQLFKSSLEMDEVCRRMASRLQIPHSQITPGKIEHFCMIFSSILL